MKTHNHFNQHLLLWFLIDSNSDDENSEDIISFYSNFCNFNPLSFNIPIHWKHNFKESRRVRPRDRVNYTVCSLCRQTQTKCLTHEQSQRFYFDTCRTAFREKIFRNGKHNCPHFYLITTITLWILQSESNILVVRELYSDQIKHKRDFLNICTTSSHNKLRFNRVRQRSFNTKEHKEERNQTSMTSLDAPKTLKAGRNGLVSVQYII